MSETSSLQGYNCLRTDNGTIPLSLTGSHIKSVRWKTATCCTRLQCWRCPNGVLTLMDLQQAATLAQLIGIWPSLCNSHMHVGATTPLSRSTSQELDLSCDIQLTGFRILASKKVSLKPGFPVQGRFALRYRRCVIGFSNRPWAHRIGRGLH
jgi:hypothetical protein